MAWLGVNLNDSINSIKGQITNFTKEVLTDDGFEDSLGDVVISKKRLKKLEDELLLSKQEVADLRNKSYQLESNLEGSELSGTHRISTLKQKLAETENELQKLKAEAHEWEWENTSPDQALGNACQSADRISLLERLLQEERQRHEEELCALKESHRLESSGVLSDFVQLGKQDDISSTSAGETVSSLKEQLQRLTEENSQLSTNLIELDSQHQEVVDRILISKEELTKELSAYKSQVNDLKEKILEKEKSTEEIKSSDPLLGIENLKITSEWEEKITILQKENFELQEKLNNVKVKLEGKENELKMNEKICKNFEEEFERQKTSLTGECDNQKRIATQKATIIDQLHDQLESHRLELLKYEAVLEEKNSEHLDAFNRMNRAIKNNDVLASQAETLNRQIQELKQQLEKKENLHKKILNACNAQNEQDLETTISETASEVASLRCERDKLAGEVSKLSQDLRSSQDLLDAMELDKAEMERECEDLRDQVEELQRGERQPPEGGSLATIQEEEDDRKEDDFDNRKEELLQQQVTALSDSRQNLELELASVKREKAEIGQRLHEFSGQLGNLANLEVEAASLRSRNESLAEQIEQSKGLMETLANVQLENTRLNDQVVQLTQSLDKLHTGADVMHEEEINELHSQLDIKTEQLARKDKQIHEYFHEISRLNNNNAAYNQIETMRAEVDKLKGLQVYKDDQIDQLKQGIEQIGEIFGIEGCDLRNVYVTIRQRYEAYTNESAKIREQLDELQTQSAASKSKDEEDVNNKLSEMEQKLTEVKEELRRQTETIDLKDQELKHSKDNLLLKEQRLNELEMKIDCQNKKIEELHKDLSSCKTELESKDMKPNEFCRKSEEAENQLSDYKQLIESLQERISTQEIEFNTERQTKTDLEKQLKGQIASLEIQNHSYKEDLNAFVNSDNDNRKKERANLISQFDEEIETLQKSNDEILKELKESKLLVSNLQKEKDQLIATSTQKHQESVFYYNEIQRLTQISQADKEVHNKALDSISRELASKKQELQKAQEELESLTKKLLKAGTGDSSSRNQVKLVQEELRRTNDEMLRQQDLLKSIQGERDQLRKTQTTLSQQYEDSLKELQIVQEKESRVSQECSRLKQHLIEMEETTTNEALLSEQRETSLKQSLAKLHEKMASHSELYSSTKEKSSVRLEKAEEKLREVIHDRDDIFHRLQISEESCHQQEESLNRLQQVLQDFQKDQSRDIINATERERRKYQEERDKTVKMEIELNKLRKQFDDLQSSLSATKNLHEELHAREDTIIALKSQVQSIQMAAKKSQEQVVSLQTFSDSKVDKPLIRNLIVGYFATPRDKQGEVLRILAQILDFSSEERLRTGLDSQDTTWMSSITNFLAPPPSNVRVTSKVDVLDHSSLSQAFIRFLEDESTPRVQPQLPAVQMAQDAQQKAQKKATTKVTSPFLMPPQVPTSNVQPVTPKETNALLEPLEQPKFLNNLLNPSTETPDDKQSS